MEKTFKTSTVLVIFNMLSQAKMTTLSDEDKIKVWKIARIIKPVASQYDDDAKDAAEKLLPYEDFREKLAKAQRYERAKEGEEKPMTDKEYADFMADFRKYNNTVNKALEEFGDKEVTLDIELVGENVAVKLMGENGWTAGQLLQIDNIIE